jgi:hypothetical protein
MTQPIHALTTPVGISGTTFNGNLVPATYPALENPQVPPPGNFSVSIAGHYYNVDTSLDFYRRTAFKHTSIPAQRDSLNFDNSSGENVVNTAGLWRRSGQNWALGAGQKFYDAKQSNPDRYFTSKGINPWVSHQLSLLQDTTSTGSLAYTASGTLVQTMTAGTYTYYLESGSLKFRNGTGAVSAAVTGLPTATGTVAYTSICHNGSYWFLACQTGGIYYGLLGGSSGSKWADTNATYAGFGLVAWVNDRLWAAGGNATTNYCGPYLFAFDPSHSAGTAPGANDIVTPDISGGSAGNTAKAGGTGSFSSNWVWSAICQGSSQVYASGYNLINGQKSDGAVFRSNNDVATASDMSVPNRALPFAAGEYPTALYGYLNYIFVGTNLGARMCQTLNAYDPNANSGGDLKAGPIVPGINYQVTQPVTAFIGYKQYVWFTWANYDGTSTGLGRMDLTNFIDDLAPAYASDLMVTGQGKVDLDWDYTQNAPLISVLVAGGKVYQQSNNLVASGTFTSGQISYDIPENKTALYLRITAPNMAGTVQAAITPDNGSPIYLGQFATNGINGAYDPSQPIPIPSSDNFAGLTGKQFNVTLTLNSAGNQSPFLSRWQLDALPQVASETNIMVVLSPYPDSVVEGADTWYDPYSEYAYLDEIRRNAQIVWYVEGNLSARVIIESLEWCPERQRADYQKGFLGLIVATLKTINGFTYQQPSLK